MIIDWHAHVYPKEATEAPFWRGRCPMTIENFLDAHHKAGIGLSVVSNSAHSYKNKTDAEVLRMVQRWNRFAAGLQRDHKEILGFANTIPCGGAGFLRELERAVREDGLKGVLINSSHNGAYPDDDPARGFWELVSDLDIPVMMHPPPVGFGEERMTDYRLASSVGRPFDNVLAIARLIVRGLFEDFPRVKFVASHLGGGICEIIGRMDYAYELQDEAFFLGAYEPMLIKKKPSDYLKGIYLDTVSYHPPAVRCAIDTIGIDKLVYGSDAPPLTSLKPRAIAVIEDLGLSAADRDKIFRINAARLLKLPEEFRAAAE
jgi:aminocarboxymuconate-semialdehyde decarboxylase